MPKIRLRGQKESKDITTEEAERVAEVWNGSYSPQTTITLKNLIFLKKDIVFLDITEEKEFRQEDKNFKDFLERKNAFAKLTSRQKAEKNSWGHFTLFYWGVNRIKPPEEMKEQVQDMATDFYEQNPSWITPSVKLWVKLLNLPKSYKSDTSAARILENSEFASIKNSTYK